MPHDSLTGGCQCGAVRYRIDGQLKGASICHCRMCQKAFGAYFAPLATAQNEAFHLTRGSIAAFRSSDVAERGFCRDCGTPLTYREIGSQTVEVALGTLDDPAAAPPVKQVGIERQLPFVAGLANLPASRTGVNAPSGFADKVAASNRQHPDHDTELWPTPAQR